MSEYMGPGGNKLHPREVGRYGAGNGADTPAERDEIYRIQEAARDVLEKNRKLMPVPFNETPREYRQRICDKLKANTSLARLDFSREPPGIFDDSEKRVYQEAAANYLRPRDVEAGKLVEVKRVDQSGREILEFATGQKGNPNPYTRPVSSFKETYKQFRGVGIQSAIYLDGVPQKLGLSPPVLKE
ncbi:hypothetical protein [Caballeronia sp. dw_276]|uniref:hypothetical protein n=1 Tax=Caballeronia sp. dw_276 TaxID=2719795 RepID=UPI001BD466B7|nr:hypothetical protein [Caballeronia sp. dw_276]